MRATPSKEWVRPGDRCVAYLHAGRPGAMAGTVVRVIARPTLPTVVVRWDSGSTGRHTITTLRRTEG